MEGEKYPFASGNWEIWKPAVFEVELVASSAVCVQEKAFLQFPVPSTVLNACVSFQRFQEE